MDYDESHRFSEATRVNLLKVESPITLLKRATHEEIQTLRLLTLVNSHVVLGTVSRGRSSSAVNFLLQRILGLGASRLTSRSSLHGCPLWAFRPTPLHKTSRSKTGMHYPPPPHHPTPLPSWACSVTHRWLQPVRRANACASSSPPEAPDLQRGNLPVFKMGLGRKPTLVKTFPRFQTCGSYLVRR